MGLLNVLFSIPDQDHLIGVSDYSKANQLCFAVDVLISDLDLNPRQLKSTIDNINYLLQQTNCSLNYHNYITNDYSFNLVDGKIELIN